MQYRATTMRLNHPAAKGGKRKEPASQVAQRGPVSLIPFQVKATVETREKIINLARRRGASINFIAGLALDAGVPIVESKLAELDTPITKAA